MGDAAADRSRRRAARRRNARRSPPRAASSGKPPVYPKAIRNVVVIVGENKAFDEQFGAATVKRHANIHALARRFLRAGNLFADTDSDVGHQSVAAGIQRVHRACRAGQQQARAVPPPESRANRVRYLFHALARHSIASAATAPSSASPGTIRRRGVPARGSRTGDPRRSYHSAVPRRIRRSATSGARPNSSVTTARWRPARNCRGSRTSCSRANKPPRTTAHSARSSRF